jgi:hypothetical protein
MQNINVRTELAKFLRHDLRGIDQRPATLDGDIEDTAVLLASVISQGTKILRRRENA